MVSTTATTMNTPTRSRVASIWSPCSPNTPAMLTRVFIAVGKSWARKNTQVIVTPSTVSSQPTVAAGARVVHGASLVSALTPRSASRNRPCSAPQATKVQFAPCHSPPISMTTSRFT